MKFIINIITYLLVVTGCSLEAWLIYGIVSMSYVTPQVEVTTSRTSQNKIVITSPATEVVSQPIVQILGYFPEEIKTVTCDITNAAGVIANQMGYVTGQFFDQKKWDQMQREMFEHRRDPPTSRVPMKRAESMYTTNFFQIYDVLLTKGSNRITIHIKDQNGKQYATRRFYTLDYSHDKAPPVLKITWPGDQSKVAGDSFTLNAQVDDDNATINTTISDMRGRIYSANAIVERNGSVWVKDLPLGPGLNKVTMVATDAAGNSSTNRLSVIKSPVSVTMRPLASDQLNKPLVNVKGTVSDASSGVQVNGITATVHSDGTWDAYKVPVSPTGMAQFKISIFSHSPTNNETHKIQ